jgi:RNA polymerase sigma-70 factor (ECF subfamily)
MPDERLLVEKCTKGDLNAQNQLFDSYANQMFRLCYRYVNYKCDAEDIMITGFHKVFKHLGNFEYREKGSLKKWIKTIMINESLMFLRKSKKLQVITSDNIMKYEASEAGIADIDAEMIYQMIIQMPVGYRTILNLYIIDGLTHEEISRELDISINTSKSQLSRARATLKEQLLKLECHGQSFR